MPTFTMILSELVKNVFYFGLLLNVSYVCCSIGLPLIQISHDDDLTNDYPEMHEQVFLEDFFWTGSGDGPPDYLKKVHTGISKGKDVVVKTETVVATVYVDGNNEVDIPICLDCFGDGTVGIDGTWHVAGMPPLNFSATDRRYWLLTVMSGFYTQKDNPILAEKLAKIYRLAFTRQQTKHLGINGVQQISGISVTVNDRNRRHYSSEQSTAEPDNYDVEILDMVTSSLSTENEHSDISRVGNKNSEWFTSSEEIVTDNSLLSSGKDFQIVISSTEEPIKEESYVTIQSWELIQQHLQSGKQRQFSGSLSQHATPLIQAQNSILLRDDQVRVIIHNITQITEAEIQKANMEGDLYESDVNDKIDERPVANQTELIYSVFVNGRPVLAVAAANDMKLVSEAEVSTVMGKEIFMKAEPYLREPQATPLAPATHSGSTGLIDSIQNNPLLVIISSIAILLLLLLLVALLLIARSHVRHKSSQQQVTRASSRNELLSEPQSGRATSSAVGLESGRTTIQSRDVGTQNFSYENDNGPSPREARIHFPAPPTRRIRRDSITSSDNTSDSSVYCPINPPTADVQRMLDEKAASLFDGHRSRRRHKYDKAEGTEEAIYTTVLSEKKREKGRHKPKRRYLSENRVGSLETSPVQSQKDYSGDEAISDTRRKYENLERTTEAFNPLNNYHRNKLLHQKTIFSDKDFLADRTIAAEAVNKHIMHPEKSSDSGSIGSFLSMQSIKAFPKNSLPEPLHRVLEPVFVTHYDNIENRGQSQHKKKIAEDKTTNSTKVTIDSFPTPKAPQKYTLMTSQSDNPDPGILGPIVWERYKKRQSADDVLDNDDIIYGHLPPEEIHSPNRDPAAIRNHYEGLLEGAIQMYSSQDDLPMPLPNKDFKNNRKQTKRELRGSSAEMVNAISKSSNDYNRPATAKIENYCTHPPSPNVGGAWRGSSAQRSRSPLVRPLSAGPFHRPDDFHTQAVSRQIDDISTAPLIEAIQNELRKFQQESR
uniref:Uncharacterized protein n=1 Tax=Glossina palpalis gambiensis TaxID=67801 RepID=A0A1B0BW79_9MUSC